MSDEYQYRAVTVWGNGKRYEREMRKDQAECLATEFGSTHVERRLVVVGEWEAVQG